MTLRTTVCMAFSAVVLSAGIASAATCNKGRVTGTDMCVPGTTEILKQGNVEVTSSFAGDDLSSLGNGGDNSSSNSSSNASQGMFRAAMNGAGGEIGDLRDAPVGSGSEVTLTLVEGEDGANGVSVVPLPAAGFMLLAGLGGLAMLRRKD